MVSNSPPHIERAQKQTLFFLRFNFKIHHCKHNCTIPVIKNSLELILLYGCWIKLEYAIILYRFVVIHILSCVNSRHYMRLQEYMDIAVWIIISKRSCKVTKSHEGKQEYFFYFISMIILIVFTSSAKWSCLLACLSLIECN